MPTKQKNYCRNGQGSLFGFKAEENENTQNDKPRFIVVKWHQVTTDNKHSQEHRGDINKIDTEYVW